MTEAHPVTHRCVAARVFVRGLTIEAGIGLYAHERGRLQPLVIDAEMDVETPTAGWRQLGETVNYELVASHARAIAAGGHIGLVERFAWRLAQACLGEPRVLKVRIRVEKPQALAPDAQAAGVEIVLERD